MKFKILVLIVVIFLAGISYLFWLGDHSVPSYIKRDFALGKPTYNYVLEKQGRTYTLKVSPTEKGYGEFLVKPTQDFNEYLNKPVDVKGDYILEDGKVMIVINEIRIR